MKSLTFLAIVATLGLSLALHSPAADAKRLGSGKSVGMQRQASTPDKTPSGTPAQTPSSPAAANAAGPSAAAAAQAASKRSWMGPLAGLAAGLGLAALASHFGFGEELASMMMMGLLVMAVIFVIGFIMRRRAQAQTPALAGAGGLNYRASATEQVSMQRNADPTPISASSAAVGAGASASTATVAKIPAGFDVAGFVRNAKVNFIRLQASNDTGNLDDIREFTTPEMFAEIKMELSDRQGASQETDVVNIGADLLEVAEEETRYVASVRFSGLIREEKNGPVAPIDEIWHLVKPRNGGGWLLAGIQQLQ